MNLSLEAAPNPYESPKSCHEPGPGGKRERRWIWVGLAAIYVSLGLNYCIGELNVTLGARIREAGDIEVWGIKLLDTIVFVGGRALVGLVVICVVSSVFVTLKCVTGRRWGLFILSIPGMLVSLLLAIRVVIVVVQFLGSE